MTAPDRKCSVQASYQPKWLSKVRLNVRFRSDGPSGPGQDAACGMSLVRLRVIRRLAVLVLPL